MLEQLDMVVVCSWCYSWFRYNVTDSKRLRKEGCCDSEHQWDSSQGDKCVTTVIDKSGNTAYYILSYIAFKDGLAILIWSCI